MNLSRFYFLPTLLIFFISCQNHESPPAERAVVNHFNDSTIQEIHQLQDERKSNELVSYFSSENENYRREAAMSMASVQDPAMIPYLTLLLDDKSAGVRSAAAYALGQLYDSAALVPLVTALQEEDSSLVVREIMESIGKVLTQDSVSIVYQFSPKNDQEKEGLAWALYRSGIRNVHESGFVEQAVNLLDTGNTFQTRLGAAHFLARTPNLVLTNYLRALRQYVSTDPAPAVRMALASAIGKVQTRKGFNFLAENLIKDEDYRVRINTIRSLGNHPERTMSDTALFIKSLSDDNVNVRVASSELLASMENLDPLTILKTAENNTDQRVKGLLFASAIKNGAGQEAIDLVLSEYEATDDPYYKSYLIAALGNSPTTYDFVVTQIFSNIAPVVSTSGVSALSTMRALPDFPESLIQPLADVMKDVMKSGDIGMVYLGSQLISNKEFDFKSIYQEDISFLHESKEKLSLPKDNEALQVLNTTIAYFEGAEEIPETTNPYNHPIDWEFIKEIPDNTEVIIETTKGEITMKMKLAESPGSVANFLMLAKQGYYDNIAFHRVVPNFVVQGGCHRGDGFGGEDYSIRSEFSDLHYGEGAVGMASAGKDTEGTQWFITHSPTPHLDGRYTIFAQVIKGMEIVHQMEVGDRILNITIPEN